MFNACLSFACHSEEVTMVQFLVGFFLGLYVATHGVGSMAEVVDTSVNTVKNIKITTEK